MPIDCAVSLDKKEQIMRVKKLWMRITVTTFLDVDTSVGKFYTNQCISNLYNIFYQSGEKKKTFVGKI